jgi:hypothetical protein
VLYIGVTGHQDLGDPWSWEWVEDRISKLLRAIDSDLIGISSLAVGADQLFAETIIHCGGKLFAVIPFADYERTFNSAKDIDHYRYLLKKSSYTTVLKARRTDEESYLAAGKLVVERSQTMVAVWNGKPAAGLGGTGDIVHHAISEQKHVIHINPSTRTVTLVSPLDVDRRELSNPPFSLGHREEPNSSI